jgi:hypothetical protein
MMLEWPEEEMVGGDTAEQGGGEGQGWNSTLTGKI